MATVREDLQLELATPGQKDRKQLLEYIEKGQIGYDATLQGPYGTRKGVCMILVWLCVPWSNTTCSIAIYKS